MSKVTSTKKNAGGKKSPAANKIELTPAQKRAATITRKKDEALAAQNAGAQGSNMRAYTPEETVGQVLTAIRQHDPETQAEMIGVITKEITVDFVDRKNSAICEANRHEKNWFALNDQVSKGMGAK